MQGRATVTVFASDVTNGRLMAVSADGVLFVARQSKGDVVALPDRDKDGKADRVDVVAADLTRPHSLAFNNGYLYIATNPAVLRVKYANGKVEGTPEKFVDRPVSTTSHWTRTIGFDKSGKLLTREAACCKSPPDFIGDPAPCRSAAGRATVLGPGSLAGRS